MNNPIVWVIVIAVVVVVGTLILFHTSIGKKIEDKIKEAFAAREQSFTDTVKQEIAKLRNSQTPALSSTITNDPPASSPPPDHSASSAADAVKTAVQQAAADAAARAAQAIKDHATAVTTPPSNQNSFPMPQPSTIVFDTSPYANDPSAKASATQAFSAEVAAFYGNYNTVVVSPNGYPLDVRGNEIVSQPVDRSGFALPSNGDPRVNTVVAGQAYQFTFTVPSGSKTQQLDAVGSPAQFFSKATYSLSPSGGSATDIPVGSGGLSLKFGVSGIPALPPGDYIFTISVNADGSLGTIFNNWS